MAVNRVKWLLLVLALIFSLFFSVTAISSGRKKSLIATINKLNGRGPYLGIISVYGPEEDAFFATGAFHPNPKHPYVDLSGRRFRVGSIGRTSVVYVRCGVGMVNAAAATQQLLDVFGVFGVVHFGISGNANNSMSLGDVIVLDQIAQTGVWDWLKSNAPLPEEDVAELDIGSYNLPIAGDNDLGLIAYSPEYFYSESGEPDTAQRTFWFQTSPDWLQLASNSLEGIKLEQCINSSLCLPEMPKLVVGLNGSTSNAYVDNAAYRQFLYNTFHVSSIDMESAAVVMTCLSNGFPVTVIRGISDLAGAQHADDTDILFGPLGASNVAKTVVQFVNMLGGSNNFNQADYV